MAASSWEPHGAGGREIALALHCSFIMGLQREGTSEPLEAHRCGRGCRWKLPSGSISGSGTLSVCKSWACFWLHKDLHCTFLSVISTHRHSSNVPCKCLVAVLQLVRRWEHLVPSPLYSGSVCWHEVACKCLRS